MKRGVAELPLHWGSAPHWLFQRMRKLSRAIAEILIGEYGSEEFLRRVADPFWFQSLGCVLGFDWHSSGLTTTLCAAIKEGVRGLEAELGLFVAGGKGKTSRATPVQISDFGKHLSVPSENLVYASRMAAKVDSAGLQDGYQLYHHTFFFTRAGTWAVVQQGMNTATRWARRYHWLSEDLESFVIDPHKAILCDHSGSVLNMVAAESSPAQKVSVEVAKESPEKVVLELKKIKELALPKLTLSKLALPAHHPVLATDINPERIQKILLKTYERPPEDFSSLLATAGVGPKTIRALALIAEVTYGARPSFRDPVSYSFAHGGKDGYPYPINRDHYDRSIAILEQAIKEAKIGRAEKLGCLKRLASIPDPNRGGN
jgi:hypothetical protein